MKKHLFLALWALISISAYAAELNPFAYELSAKWLDSERLQLSFKTNAAAKRIDIYVIDGYGTEYLIRRNSNNPIPAGQRNEVFTRSELLSLNVPANKDLKWRVDVLTTNASGVIYAGRKVTNIPVFSIDIDNNPASPYFGRILATQPANTGNNGAAGIYAYNPDFTVQATGVVGNGINLSDDNWYDYNHATPYRIRIAQDGTGTIFLGNFDPKQTAYLWQVDPANLESWSTLLTREYMNTKVGKDADGLTDYLGPVYNFGLDIRKSGEGYELLLLSGRIETKTNKVIENFVYGMAFSGIYNTTTSTYTPLSLPPNKTVDADKNVRYILGNAIAATAQFDKNGNVWYCGGSSNGTQPEYPGLAHQRVGQDYNGIKINYHSSNTLFQKQYTHGGGFRNDRGHNRVVITRSGKTSNYVASVYTVDHSGTHPTLSGRADIICSDKTDKWFVMDFAWDYADNIFVAVRNTTTSIRGVYAFATGKTTPISTPAQEPIQVICEPNARYTINVVCDPTEGGSVTASVEGVARTGAVLSEIPSCSSVTLTAIPDEKYKFVNWTDENGNVLSTNKEYTFIVTQDASLTAKFEFAEYTGVEWYNLFQDGQDITTIRINESDNNVNNRLCYLFLAYLQEKFTSYPISSFKPLTQKEDNKSALWITSSLNKNMTDAAQSIMNAESSSFYWLSKFVLDKTGENFDFSVSDRVTKWLYLLHLFMNRTKWCYNANGGNNVNTYVDHMFNNEVIPDFSQIGHPDYWRPYWAEYACNLPRVMRYDTPMPIEWKQIPAPTTYVTYDPSGWYIWNNPPADKSYLLAWRKGGTAVTNEIVHHVYENDMELYATYVDKNLQEKDPEPSHQYDAKNDDICKLLANSKYGSSTLHNITVDRKLQGGMYNTICLPFDVYADQVPDVLQNAEIKQFTGVSETYNESGDPVAVLNFEDVTPTQHNILLEARRPYLIKPEKDVDGDYITFENIKYGSVATDGPYKPTVDGVTFQGVFNPTTVPAGAVILVANNRLAVNTTNSQMYGFRAYFQFEDAYLQSLAEQGRVYLSMKKPVTTSVPLAPEAEKQTAPEVKKVMYDGKIYILRGDEVYSITGQRVQ